MAPADSLAEPKVLRQARTLLAEPPRAESAASLAAAAAFFALSALALVATVLLIPPR
ncbi:MAG: hypothetical protein ACHP7N_14825 [Caulobacterales bacterium]